MNPPPVRYVHTADGLAIAYTDSGEGPPLLLVPGPPVSNVGEAWDLPSWGDWLRRLESRHRLVFVDLPGLGLSDPDVSDLSHEAIEAIVLLVADTLGIERFALMSAYAGAAALLLAGAHPERVSAVVLINPVALDHDAYKDAAPITAMRQALERDFDTYLHLMTTAGVGHHVEREQAEAFLDLVRRSNRAEAIRAYFDNTDAWSLAIRDRLPSIGVPTLITWPRESTAYGTVASARRVAGALPDARLALTDGDAVFPTSEMATSADRAIEAFFAERAELTAVDRRGFQTIVFTDLQGSTEMQARLGDAAAHEVVRVHDQAVREATERHHGREIKHTGDGMMTAFDSAVDAVRCALAIREEIQRFNDGEPGEPLRVRFGINAGEPIQDREDLFGLSVTLAARIGDWGGPGQVLVSDVVRQLLLGKGFVFDHAGDAELKGFDSTIPVFRVENEPSRSDPS